MRTLKFTANCENHEHGVNACHVTQKYVTDLLSTQLSQYGFKTETTHSADQLAVSVEEHPVALGVSCRLNEEDGSLLCEISAHADEEQVWFKKIATQSVIKQLADAVENTLKEDDAFSFFEWKS